MRLQESTVISFEGVSFSYGKTLALNDVSFSLKKREIFGYLGPNGAGKTTTIHILLGLLSPSSGECHVRATRKGFMLDKPAAFDELTVTQNLQFFSKLHGVLKHESAATGFDEIIEAVGVTEYKQRQLRTLSLGMRKRVELACALLPNPDLLLLDEPTSGLDPVGQYQVRELIKTLANSRGCTVLISSHNLPEVESLCTRFAILNKGKIVANKTMEELHDSGRSLEQSYLELVKQ